MERRCFLYEILAFACILVSLAAGMTKVRLRGSNNPWEGRVEILYNGTWSKICSSYYSWSQTEADVVCRELGFSRSRVAYRSAPWNYRSANASVPIAWTGVSCTGRESTIFNCSYTRYTRYPYCYGYYNRGVAVKCLNLTRENIIGNCNFEFLDMCNYTQDTQGNDETDWKLQKARSYYWYSHGPNRDHTFMSMNDGYYVMVNDRRARLISPVIKNKGCITFYYYFYGQRYYSQHLKSLKVYVKMANSYPKLIWRLQETTSNGWEMGQIPLNGSAMQVIFEGEAPKSSSSYYRRNSVSLDDITVSTGPCRIFPEEAKTVLDNQPSGEIRLVGGTNSSGRVLVLHKQQWGRVCGDYDWDIKEANVVCRYLGFKGAEAALKNSVFGKGKGPIVLQRVRCAGFEPSLSQCSHDGWEKVTNCGYSSGDAAVICKTSTDYKVRLNGSSDTPYKGRVEVNVGGNWFAVDEREWDLRDGNVACREVGYAGAYGVTAAGDSRSSIKGLGNLRCRGNESSLQQCNHTMLQYRWYSRDAAVKCYNMRLVGGKTKKEGRVEVQYEGVWGTVCNKNWDKKDADVVCRTLGFNRASPRNCCPMFGEGTGPIVVDDAQCTGKEIGLSFCRIRGWGLSMGCTHAHDVGVACESKIENIKGNCNFDFSDMCNYTQDTQGYDETDWKLQQARSVHLHASAPNRDHTLMSSNGYYVMVDDRRARLISPVIQNKRCITFYYNFYGPYNSYLKSLKVYVKMANSYPKLKWRLQQSNLTSSGWEMGQVSLNGSAVQVIFEGEVPKPRFSYYSGHSVSLDDITVSTVPCDISPKKAKIIYVESSTEIRLVGGTNSSGIVQVLHNRQWGRVCGDYDWDIKEANVVCRYLGFKGAEAALKIKNNVFGKRKEPIFLQRVRCAGIEPSLSQCSHDDWEKVSNCRISYGDAAVICKTSTDYKVRLSGSSGTPYKGKVEVNVGGVWFAVDEGEWDIRDGNVACRQLGYAGAYRVSAAGGSSVKGLGNLRCRGNESSLQQCDHTMMQYRWHSPDAAVNCYNMRLVGGRTKMEGRVEVQYGGVWGTVCMRNKIWNKKDADVVCRTLGFDQAKSTNCCPTFEEGTGHIVVGDVQCDGTEIGLSFCKIQAWGLAIGCTHAHDMTVACEYKLELSKVEIVLKESLVEWNQDTFLKDLVEVLNNYCREKNKCGDYISDNKTRISIEDIEVSRFEHDSFYLDRLVVEIGVRANLKNGTTISLSNDVLFKAIYQKRTLAGHQILFIDNQAPTDMLHHGHHVTKQKKSYRTVIIVVVVVMAGLLLISAFVYLLIRRKRRVQRLEGLVPQDHAYTPLLSDDQEENETLDVEGLLVPPVEDRDNTEEVVA